MKRLVFISVILALLAGCAARKSAVFAAAESNLANGRIALAEEFYRKTIQQDGENVEAAVAHFRLAYLLKEKSPEQAQKHADEFARLIARNIESLKADHESALFFAWAALSVEKTKLAAALLEDLPNDCHAAGLKAELANVRGDFEAAARISGEMLEPCSYSPPMLVYAHALSLYHLEAYGELIDFALFILPAYPQQEEILILGVRGAMAAGDCNAATDLLFYSLPSPQRDAALSWVSENCAGD